MTNKGDYMTNLVMKIGNWGIAHNGQTMILVGLGIIMLGFIAWDFKTSMSGK